MPTFASSNGYLDTPAKYRELAEQKEALDDYEQVSQGVAHDQQPPAKRRRGLTGSIVSTAVSAALIGTAVGLTVYRLWRDRGKDTEPPVITVGPAEASASTPPPPYSSSDPQGTPTLNVVPSTPRTAASSRKPRHHRTQSARKRPRKVHHQTLHNIASFGPSTSSTVFPPTQASFDFSSPSFDAPPDDEDGDEGDQMDWIGHKLSSLIEEGKKALGREVVVSYEAKEDEVDDGGGEWMDEEFGVMGNRTRGRSIAASHPRSGSASRRPAIRRTGAGLAINPSPYGTAPSASSASPRRDLFNVSPQKQVSPHESSSSWQSQELRESMERARAQVRERLLGVGSS
ncbi:hypothetical protein BDP27DRAFT_1327936 [Rhodocollybia butyracea]|uniref:Uncharacterized protein n=1 Tax=Rhodocollybia butyracea TaxID=206335 RepID=A0A9P5U5S4_9AGAR|nr:hypothetical protein BDP27DRAFT_1327936 [Rhodocollybia butyracea]